MTQPKTLYAAYSALIETVLTDLVADGVLPAGTSFANVTLEPPRDDPTPNRLDRVGRPRAAGRVWPLHPARFPAAVGRPTVGLLLMSGSVHGTEAPSGWITRWAHLLPRSARVLDVACGAGRHTRWLAAQGHRLTAVR